MNNPPKEVENRRHKVKLNLVDHKRKIAITMNPLGKHVVHNCFTSWSNLQEPHELQESKSYSSLKLSQLKSTFTESISIFLLERKFQKIQIKLSVY